LTGGLPWKSRKTRTSIREARCESPWKRKSDGGRRKKGQRERRGKFRKNRRLLGSRKARARKAEVLEEAGHSVDSRCREISAGRGSEHGEDRIVRRGKGKAGFRGSGRAHGRSAASGCRYSGHGGLMPDQRGNNPNGALHVPVCPFQGMLRLTLEDQVGTVTISGAFTGKPQASSLRRPSDQAEIATVRHVARACAPSSPKSAAPVPWLEQAVPGRILLPSEPSSSEFGLTSFEESQRRMRSPRDPAGILLRSFRSDGSGRRRCSRIRAERGGFSGVPRDGCGTGWGRAPRRFPRGQA